MFNLSSPNQLNIVLSD